VDRCSLTQKVEYRRWEQHQLHAAGTIEPVFTTSRAHSNFNSQERNLTLAFKVSRGTKSNGPGIEFDYDEMTATLR
jgi:hypothetical protein